MVACLSLFAPSLHAQTAGQMAADCAPYRHALRLSPRPGGGSVVEAPGANANSNFCWGSFALLQQMVELQSVGAVTLYRTTLPPRDSACRRPLSAWIWSRHFFNTWTRMVLLRLSRLLRPCLACCRRAIHARVRLESEAHAVGHPIDYRRIGWGGRIRTCVWRDQNPLPYHLATPQQDREPVAIAAIAWHVAANDPVLAPRSRPSGAAPARRAAALLARPRSARTGSFQSR